MSHPWSSWSHELPDRSNTSYQTQLNQLNDEKFHREMHQEIRANFYTQLSNFSLPNSCVLLMGGTSADFELYDSDTEKCEFRQEMFFRYLFQINEPDCFGVINVEKKKSVLFVPYCSDDSERWNGTRLSLSYYIERYGVDEAYYVSDLDKYFQDNQIQNLYCLYGQNLDSGSFTKTFPVFDGIEKYNLNKDVLHPILCELRAHKNPKEIELMRLGTLISSQGHVYVMRHIKPGMTEIQLEALFKAWVGYHGGCRHMAYTCICGSGPNGSILHYGHAGRPNDRILKEGDTVVLDMGAEYFGYATDLTRSYAINGKFTPDQEAIHNAVVEAQNEVIKALKPGVYWADMHRLAERVIVSHLLKIGILHNGNVEELMNAHMGSVFMPHGLGHLIGMNVHDVGGYLPGESKSCEPGLCWLRCGRKLESGMVITVEPGIYFNDPWLNKALSDPIKKNYINSEVLKKFRGSGGCRLEDDVLITENGAENFSVMPTTVQEIHEVIALHQ